MSATWTILAGTCRGEVLLRMRRRIRSSSRVVETDAVAQPDEQHDPFVALPLLADDQALDDLVELLDLPIDLGRADADAAGVERRRPIGRR